MVVHFSANAQRVLVGRNIKIFICRFIHDNVSKICKISFIIIYICWIKMYFDITCYTKKILLLNNENNEYHYDDQ